MLSELSHDPALVQKRLGDGCYEQQLVRDQIGRLTGRRFLKGYASEEAQYRALLQSGIAYAKQWHLRPGVSLSAAQRISDVEPDGSMPLQSPHGSPITGLNVSL